MRHRPPQGTGQLTDLEQARRLLEGLSAVCAQDGVTVESAAPDAIDGVSPRLLAATRAGSPAGEPIILRRRGGREVIAVVDGQGHPADIWEAIRVRAGLASVIRRRVKADNLIPGLTAIAVKSNGRITVFVSRAIPVRLQRAGGRAASLAARCAGWTSNRVPALVLFTGASLWRAAFASGARRLAVAGSAALILAVAIGAVLTGAAHSPPARALITPVTPGSAPSARGGINRADHSRHAQTHGHGRTRFMSHRQPHGASTRTASRTPTGAAPTAATSTPTRSSPSTHPSTSPDPSPSPSPTKTRHCILLFC